MAEVGSNMLASVSYGFFGIDMPQAFRLAPHHCSYVAFSISQLHMFQISRPMQLAFVCMPFSVPGA
jgi:hypothetical protein